ncbi:hypothetical protein K466DRAFT_649708 [Polyporus arcularius HHB13444]|uniref:Fungal-type protein kinase domain-containing protein n=1 Tax=Polyporus arcularius HHB13444 TaxID=1314778 RepID=A0A5C3PW93_9APHY|nr:hypothetical protein K466DRAFT_649708 [Polyporus arcularius HHB13444]
MSISTSCIGTSTCRSVSSAVLQASPVVYDGWKAELSGRIHIYPGRTTDFIDTFVPSSHSYTLTDDVTGAFSQYRSRKGKEVKSYPGLVTGLNKLVASFDPAHKPTFHNTRKLMMPFPFAAFAENHHASSPDISVGFPGADTSDESLKLMEWQGICIAMEVKSKPEQDPFVLGRAGKENNRTAIQLSRNARNLLLAHGFLAAFVIGIYGDNVRIARYDHTCAVVSEAFSLRKHPRLLQKFFWHFAHPMIGPTVVGCDPSIRKLHSDEKEWIRSQLRKAGQDVKALTSEIDKGRRVVVLNDADETYKTYLLYHLVDVNARLFSRATTVWRAMEDTRNFNADDSDTASDDLQRSSDDSQRSSDESEASSEDSQTTQSPTTSTPGKTVIFKEAWRQLVRTPETEFYKRMAQTFGEDETKWKGLARFVCGGDQGQEEVRQWERSSPNASAMSQAERDLRLHTSTSTAPPPQAPPATSSARGPAPQNAAFELPYPQHQTFSWTLAKGAMYTHRERSQIRIVVEDVGRPLTTFTNTFELVCAIMAAIEGHKTAWEIAGILHRDVSLGNILISSDPERNGFLHDFDYSSMKPDPPGNPSTSDAEKPSSDDPRKERTGTYYYMALEILETEKIIHDVPQDLQSFYWVLMWVVLRHTEHCLGQGYCAKLFKFGDEGAAAQAKSHWIDPYNAVTGEQDIVFEVKDNAPLTTLIEDFRLLISDSIYHRRGPPPIPLTYDSVLAIFRKAVGSEGWPKTSDFVDCHLLKKTVETAIVGAPGDETLMGDQGEGIDVDVVEDDIEDSFDDDMDDVGVPTHHDDPSHDEPVDDIPPLDDTSALDNGPAVDNDPVIDNDASADDAEPQPEGPTTRSRTKRNADTAAPAPGPAPSGSSGSSKRRKTNPPPPPVARNGSGSRSRGTKRHTTRRGSGGRGGRS